MTLLTPEQRAARFALVYGSDKFPGATSDEEAKELLAKFDRAYKKAADERCKILVHGREMKQGAFTYELGDEQPEEILLGDDKIHLTFVRRPKCLYCSDRATVSCFVETAEMFFQITCESHIPETAIIMWRKETL